VLAEFGAVSAEVAAAMAHGARDRLDADVAVAVTGIAGPGGGTEDKPVGLVYVHAAGPMGERELRLDFPGDRETIRGRAAVAALHVVRRLVTEL
jgi:nicotinamide-nucleotide amidase